MRKIKQWTAMGLATVMAMSLSACAGSKGGTSETTSAAETSKAAETTSAAASLCTFSRNQSPRKGEGTPSFGCAPGAACKRPKLRRRSSSQ